MYRLFGGRVKYLKKKLLYHVVWVMFQSLECFVVFVCLFVCSFVLIVSVA